MTLIDSISHTGSLHVAVEESVVIVTTTLDGSVPPFTTAQTVREPASSLAKYSSLSSDILGPWHDQEQKGYGTLGLALMVCVCVCTDTVCEV